MIIILSESTELSEDLMRRCSELSDKKIFCLKNIYLFFEKNQVQNRSIIFIDIAILNNPELSQYFQSYTKQKELEIIPIFRVTNKKKNQNDPDTLLAPVDGRDLNHILIKNKIKSDHRTITSNIDNSKILTSQLIDRREIYRSIVELSPDCILIHENMRINFINPYGTQMLGADKPELLLGLDIINYIHPDYKKIALDRFKALDSGSVELLPQIELDLINIRGRSLKVECVSKKIPGTCRTLIMTVARDITETSQTRIQLIKNEERYNMVSEAVNIGFWEFNHQKNELFLNPQCYRLLGYKPNEFQPTLENWFQMIHPDDRLYAEKRFNSLNDSYNFFYSNEYRMKSKSGKYIWIRSTGKLTDFNEGGNSIRSIGIHQDINDRKKIEIILIENEERLLSIFHAIPDPVTIIDAKTNICMDVNESFEKVTGWTRDEVVGGTYDDFNLWVDGSDRKTMIEMLNKNDSIINYEARFRLKDNRIITGLISAIPMTLQDHSFIVTITKDISSRKTVEKQLRQSLLEKETLLKEIHHRVKNNLQVIVSLLGIQSFMLEGDNSNEHFIECQNRIIAISKVHEYLYHQENMSCINFELYIKELTDLIHKSYTPANNNIEFNICAPSICLNLELAIPCGLIINELVTNSLKHAFLSHETGTISIDFKNESPNFKLSVSDNGKGFDVNIKNSSLGLKLIEVLTSQINGQLTFTDKNGTNIEIIFPQNQELSFRRKQSI